VLIAISAYFWFYLAPSFPNPNPIPPGYGTDDDLLVAQLAASVAVLFLCAWMIT